MPRLLFEAIFNMRMVWRYASDKEATLEGSTMPRKDPCTYWPQALICPSAFGADKVKRKLRVRGNTTYAELKSNTMRMLGGSERIGLVGRHDTVSPPTYTRSIIAKCVKYYQNGTVQARFPGVEWRCIMALRTIWHLVRLTMADGDQLYEQADSCC